MYSFKTLHFNYKMFVFVTEIFFFRGRSTGKATGIDGLSDESHTFANSIWEFLNQL